MGRFIKMEPYRNITSFRPHTEIGRFIDAMKSPLLTDVGIYYQERIQFPKKPVSPGDIDELTDNQIIAIQPECPDERKVESIHESKDSEMAGFSRDIDESINTQAVVLQHIPHSKAAFSLELKQASDKPHEVNGERENKIQKGMVINHRVEMKRAKGKTLVEVEGKDNLISNSHKSTQQKLVESIESQPTMVDPGKQKTNKVAPIYPSDGKKELNTPVIPLRKPQVELTGDKEKHQKEMLTFKSKGDVYSRYDLPAPYKDIASWIKEAKVILEQITELLPLLTKRAKEIESKQSFQMIKKVPQAKKMQSPPIGKSYDNYLFRSYQGNFYLGI